MAVLIIIIFIIGVVIVAIGSSGTDNNNTKTHKNNHKSQNNAYKILVRSYNRALRQRTGLQTPEMCQICPYYASELCQSYLCQLRHRHNTRNNHQAFPCRCHPVPQMQEFSQRHPRSCFRDKAPLEIPDNPAS